MDSPPGTAPPRRPLGRHAGAHATGILAMMVSGAGLDLVAGKRQFGGDDEYRAKELEQRGMNPLPGSAASCS